MSAMVFKVGDKARVVSVQKDNDDSYERLEGTVVTITEIWQTGEQADYNVPYPYGVDGLWFAENELRLVSDD